MEVKYKDTYNIAKQSTPHHFNSNISEQKPIYSQCKSSAGDAPFWYLKYTFSVLLGLKQNEMTINEYISPKIEKI